MSILLMSKVFKINLRLSLKMVLLVLADFASDDGKNIFPSVSTIAKKSSLSRRSVQTIIRDLLGSGILHSAKNPHGGAPGSTRHLEINLAALENLMKLSRDEDSASVQKRGAKERSKGVQTDVKTGAAAAPKPSYNLHQITTTDESLDSSRGSETDVFDWPPQLDSNECEAIQIILSRTSNSKMQKQFALDELRAALVRREITRKAAWIRTLLEKGVERTTAGRAYERSRGEKNRQQESSCQKPSGVEKEFDKTDRLIQIGNFKKKFDNKMIEYGIYWR